MNFGIEAIELYFPRTYVDQTDLEKYLGVSEGKHTKGLGQLQLSFANPQEDVNSLALTVTSNLLKNHGIDPASVGRLEVGTETLVDKSKSTKTHLMTLFKGHHDIQGATSINACYGATNALLNTLNWMSSAAWDGRYGIVVATDVAVYAEGPARPTGGAGAVAILIGPKPKIIISPLRASFVDHQYDFYKPIPSSEYPIVDGKVSMDCYMTAMRQCYLKLKQKKGGVDLLAKTDYLCFHSPFYKMVQKAFDALIKVEYPNAQAQQIVARFKQQVNPSLFISQRLGNIYTGSLYACLFSLLYTNPNIANKQALLFSYGSGLCSTMMELTIISNPLSQQQIGQVDLMFKERVKVSAKDYSQIMMQKQLSFGKFRGKIQTDMSLIGDGVYYLQQIDDKWRRIYKIKSKGVGQLTKKNVSVIERIQNLDKRIPKDTSKFYKLAVEDRRDVLTDMTGVKLSDQLLDNGGLSMKVADGMIQNVIGKLALPLGVVPMLMINRKKYAVPMCIEEPSVVAATSSIGKFINPYSFLTSSTPSLMIGQVHLPAIDPSDSNAIIRRKTTMINQLNADCQSMVKRGGGVKDIRVRQLLDSTSFEGEKSCSLDITIDVCDAMGANITNTIAEKAKQIVARMGIKTGISVLSNYCIQRKAVSSFSIPVEHMAWKGVSGLEVAERVLEAYKFAKVDPFRAVTHNKGIMNGIDAVCLATGQDWRAVESAAHTFAGKSGKYQPLTHYQIISKDGKKFFRGLLELPIAVGTVGGAITRNPLYVTSLNILGNPSAQQLSEIIVTVGLAQNFAALRALAIEGIQRGHMRLHARSIAVKMGVPPPLIQDCCSYMQMRKKYDDETVKTFLQWHSKPRL